MKTKPFIALILFLALSHQPMTAAPTYRVYGTREGLQGNTTANGHVIGWHDHFVALPSGTVLNSNGGYTYTVTIRNPANGRVASNVPVWDKGPWNLTDNYWHNPRVAKFAGIAMGTPAAVIQYQNRTLAEDGQVPANPAGIDIADGTFWDDLAMTDNGYVDVTYNWEAGSPPPSSYTPGDFTANSRTDYVLWTPATGLWKIRDSAGTGAISSFNWGGTGDIPLIGNWTMATGAEAAVWRPSTGVWWIRFQSGANAQVQWGSNGDIPLIGAWSGQMRDQAVFRPSNGTWYIRFGNTGSTATVPWGANGDIPLVGNWSGSGMVDQVMFRPSAGIWYVRNGATGAASSFAWGGNGDVPLIGEWSGRMRDAIAWRPSTGTWYIRFGDTGSNVSFQFGLNGDMPMVGNVFGHGVVDQILFRPSNGTWYVRDGSNGTVWTVAFGGSGDKLVHE
jgi:hypothetical protein